jgi:hypothetical protein
VSACPQLCRMGDPTDLATQMPPIDGDGLQGPDRGFEQDGVDDGLVLKGDRPIVAGTVNTTWK